VGHKKIDRPIYGPPEARACLEGLTIREDVELWLLPYRAAMTLTAHAEVARRLAELPASVQSAEVDLERLRRKYDALGVTLGAGLEPTVRPPLIADAYQAIKSTALWTDLPEWIKSNTFQAAAVQALADVRANSDDWRMSIAITNLQALLMSQRTSPEVGVVAATLVACVAEVTGKPAPPPIELALLAVAAGLPDEPVDERPEPTPSGATQARTPKQVLWRDRADKWRKRLELAVGARAELAPKVLMRWDLDLFTARWLACSWG